MKPQFIMPKFFPTASVFSLTFLLLAANVFSTTGDSFEVEVRTDAGIPMRDGITLSANIFLPKADGPFPVILQRTPYGKGDEKNDDGFSYASHGYAFVSQDCRGKGASQGTWEPFVNERADGQDTQNWIAQQPWCNGRIGTLGTSYVGFTQWIVAPEAGGFLKTMVSIVPLTDPYDDCINTGGAVPLAMMMGWGGMTSYLPSEENPMNKWGADQWLAAFRTLPLGRWDQTLNHQVDYLREWINHPAYDKYWAKRGIPGQWRNITVPSFVMTGWYDLFIKGTLDHTNAVRSQSRSPIARSHQHVLIGPWPHALPDNEKIGDLNFGPDSTLAAIHPQKIRLQWFDRWLNGNKNGVDDWPPFRIFVMGRNQWRDEQEWPLKRTCYTPWYFNSQGAANTLSGDGRLCQNKPNREKPTDAFVYNPEDPVPTAGGCTLMGCPTGPLDQTAVEKRPDVLVFTSDELKADIEVTGPVKVVLYAASSAVDTDWTAKLVDVHPDGRPINLCDGIIRARCRKSTKNPTLIKPGKIYRYEIDLWVTSNVFLAGHKVRVEISSSNFPRFDRNLNTGEPIATATRSVKATQTIYHDDEHPSHILLPIIPSSFAVLSAECAFPQGLANGLGN